MRRFSHQEARYHTVLPLFSYQNRDSHRRFLPRAGVHVGDGGLGLWAALGEVFPATRRQRCWNHKALNVRDRPPEQMHEQAKAELRDIWNAPTKEECLARAERYAKKLRLLKQDAAAETVLRDLEDFVTFYDFPREHWKHLRTMNPIESVFAGVRLRTNVTKRMRSQRTALYLVFKTIQRLAIRWRSLNPPALLERVLAGKVFRDGSEIESG